MATPISQMPLRMKGQTTCSHHKGRQLDFFCEKCQELVCPKCLSSVHKGHMVCEISEITPQKVPDIKNFIDRTEKNDLVQIGKYINSTDTFLKDNTSSFEKLSQQLKMQTDKLKQELDILTAQTLSVYQKMEEDNNKLIKKYKQDLEMYEKQLKQQIQECKTALQEGSHIQIYDTFCEIHSPTYSLPVKPVLGTANFTPNENHQEYLREAIGEVIASGQGQTLTDQDRSVTTSDDLGQPSTQQQQQQSGTKVKKVVTTKLLLPQTKVVEEWESPCYIDSICPTTDGQVWTKFFGTLTLLDRKGKVIQQGNHNVYISDISLSPTTHTLWVCDRKNNILELVSGRLTNRFSTKEEPRCICVTASNNVIVGMSKHVSKFTTNGKMVCTTMAKGTGKPLVCTPHRISECPVTHNVAVTDFSEEIDGDRKGRVVVMDTDFKELFVYRGDIPSTYKPTPQTEVKPFEPRGVVYDSVGNLIIGDRDNNRVLLISGGGEFLRVLHTDTDWTETLGIDREVEDVLWAVFGYNNGVKLLQYSSVGHL